MNRRTLLRRGGLVAALGLAGCSGSPTETDGQADEPTDEETDEPTDTPTDSSTATDTPTESTGGDGGTATPTETASPTATPPQNPEQRVLVAPEGKLRFSPESFSISTGDTVLWEWRGNGHNVSPESQPSDADWPGMDEELYGEGTTYFYTFDVSGQYEYHCDPHQSVGMRGSFTVE